MSPLTAGGEPPTSAWRDPSEVLSPEQLEYCSQVGVAARALIDDRAYHRAVMLLAPALLEAHCAEPDDGHRAGP